MVDTKLKLDSSVSWLHPDYQGFIATTNRFAPDMRIGTHTLLLFLQVSYGSLVHRMSGSHVPHTSLSRTRAASMPDAALPVSTFLQYFFVADYDKAIFYYKKVLKKPLSFLSIGMLFSTYRNLSRSYQGKKDYENAEIYAVKAVELSKIVFEKKDLQYISSKKTLDTIRRIKGGGKRGWGE